MKKRVQWIDCAKGIAILLVIIGHTIGYPIREMIFSFHMPLFFILAGAVHRYSDNFTRIMAKSKESFKQLIIPAVAAFICRSYIQYGTFRFKDILWSIVWGERC